MTKDEIVFELLPNHGGCRIVGKSITEFEAKELIKGKKEVKQEYPFGDPAVDWNGTVVEYTYDDGTILGTDYSEKWYKCSWIFSEGKCFAIDLKYPKVKVIIR